MSSQAALDLLLAVALVVSVVTDLWRRKLSLPLSCGLLVTALALRFALEGFGEEPEQGLASGLIGAGAAVLVFGSFALWGKGLGRGEVALVVAVCGTLGYPTALAAMMFISVVGAGQAIVSVLWKREASATFRGMLRGRQIPVQGALVRGIPYGVAIALGSAWAMWWSRSAN